MTKVALSNIMHTMFEIKNAVFLESAISPENLGHFAVSINGMRKRVYLGMYYNDPETGKVVQERSFSEDCKFIKNLIPGEIVNLLVNVWEATPKDARHDVFSLARMSKL
jgi:hypothetical protein